MKDNRVYLLHIRDAIQRVLSYISGGKKAFLSDPKTQDAVVRNLEVIGEAVKNLSDGFKAGHKNIPWRRIAGMRDKMIHEYFGVDLELVWDVAARELPNLKREIEGLLERLG